MLLGGTGWTEVSPSDRVPWELSISILTKSVSESESESESDGAELLSELLPNRLRRSSSSSVVVDKAIGKGG